MADAYTRIGQPGNKYWGIAFARDRYLEGHTSGMTAAMEMSCAIGDLLRALEKELI